MIIRFVSLLVAFLLGLSVAGADPSRVLLSRPGAPGAATPQIVSGHGARHSCLLPGDGSVQCWGENSAGQLGDGTTDTRTLPVKAQGISDAVQLAIGNGYTCAVRASGAVSCWGSNFNGNLGDGTTTDRLSPVPVAGLSGAVAVTAGMGHTCALLASGGVRCWGLNSSGQLGNGGISSSSTPVTVLDSSRVPLARVVMLAAGQQHTCALIVDGAVRCWGLGSNGQTGIGGSPIRVLFATLVQVSVSETLSSARAVAAGTFHSCALLSDGSVHCWGSNAQGQLGTGGNAQSGTAVPVSGLTNATAIQAGNDSTCALLGDGSARCWGSNANGRLGNGSTLAASPIPVPVTGVANASGVAMGSGHSCALVDQGRVLCWGRNREGELGDGTNVGSNVPIVTALSRSVSAVALGSGLRNVCAARAEGLAACWGANALGQTGIGATTPSSVLSPTTVVQLAGAVDVAPGSTHVCALLANGDVSCWGSNVDGQLGDGRFKDSLTPVLALRGQRSVASGISHACAVNAGGFLSCWGANASKQISSSASTRFGSPVVVDSGVVQAVVGHRHICWLKTGGAVRCRGSNALGQLGDGTTNVRTDNASVIGLTNIVAISAGSNHTCALRVDGFVRCWGANENGQLGDGRQLNSPLPVPVAGIVNASAVSAGGDTSCALLADGTARCWGNNAGGNIGDGTKTLRLQPTPVTRPTVFCSPLRGCVTTAVNLSSLVGIEVGGNQTCALQSSGAPFCWGINSSGQLGDGTTTEKLRANEVPSFRFNIAPTVALRPVGPVVAALLNCAVGQKAMVELTLIQGAMKTSASGVRNCAGGLERYEFLTSAWLAGFVPGGAEVRARASILAPSDGSAASGEAGTQSWTRNVTLTAAP